MSLISRLQPNPRAGDEALSGRWSCGREMRLWARDEAVGGRLGCGREMKLWAGDEALSGRWSCGREMRLWAGDEAVGGRLGCGREMKLWAGDEAVGGRWGGRWGSGMEMRLWAGDYWPFSANYFTSRPRHSRILSALRVTLLMPRVCFKPISLFQMYHVIGSKLTCVSKRYSQGNKKQVVGAAVDWNE